MRDAYWEKVAFYVFAAKCDNGRGHPAAGKKVNLMEMALSLKI